MSRIRVGIIGAGDISQFHIKTLKGFKGVEVISIADVDLGRAEGMASRFNIKNHYKDYRDLMDRELPDVVHVLTPPQSHYQISKDFMIAGCDVLIEKPMAMTLDEAKDMESVSQKNKKHLSVCEMYNFDPVVQNASKLVSSGDFGNVLYMENYWFTDITAGTNAYSFKGDGSGWALDLPGGAFSNFIDHPLYLQREFLGQITGADVKHKKLGDNPFIPYDELQITLSGPHCTGYIFSSLVGKPRINTFRVYCEDGIITGDISNMALTTSRNRKIPNFIAKGVNNIANSYELFSSTFKTTASIMTGKIKPRQGLIGFLENFYKHYRSDDPIKSAPLSYDVKKFVETIYLSELVTLALPRHKEANRFIKKYSNSKSSLENKGASKVERPVLVTGAGGFLGRALVERLIQEGHKVRVVTRKIDRNWEKDERVEVMYGDIRDINCVKELVKGVHKICHCAAHVTNKGQYEVFEDSNVKATENLLRLGLEQDIDKFVFISSIIVYGFQKPRKTMTEDSPTGVKLPRYSYYATSKMEAEDVVNRFHTDLGVNTTILRPGIIYGKSSKPFKSKFRIVFGSRRDLLPYVYIQDVVDSIVLALHPNSTSGETYNIVGNENVGQGYFLKAQNSSLNTSQFIFFIPKVVMFSVAYMLESLFKRKNMNYPPPFGLFHYKSLVRNMKYSNDKARTEMGWEPRFDIEKGFIQTNRA